MAKKKGKKLKEQGSITNSQQKKIRKKSMKNKKKRSKIDAPSVSVKDPPSTTMLVPVVTPIVVATTSTVAYENNAKQGKRKEDEIIDQTPGFIFMCNGITKPECYRNRVFGLPKGQVELVEKIKPGAKLFLFDFDLKLLYGVYEATSKGELGLEPAAFNGKFPAQVRFKIFKECLPLTDKAFKHAIKDNYQGPKFRQDLTGKQVKTLISLFRPIIAPTSVIAAPTLTNVVTRHTYPVPVREERFQLPSRPPPAYGSSGVRYGIAVPPSVSQSEQVVARLPYDQQQSETYTGHGQPPLEPRHIVQQAARLIELYYSMEAHQPYLPEKPFLSAQDPHARYAPAWEVVKTDRVTGYVSEHHTSELARNREAVLHSGNMVDYYGRNPPAASASHVLLQTHEQRNLLSSYQPHYPVTTSQHLHQPFVAQHSDNAVNYYAQNLPPASASHFLLQTHAQRDLLSSYQPHYAVTTNNDLRPVYADPLQRLVYGSSSSAEASLPVSSHYPIAGAATTYPPYH
ncbi:hypothetical protein ACOSP7_031717 [Xanthoceras sorbifolium]